jgi:hypothetical protein
MFQLARQPRCAVAGASWIAGARFLAGALAVAGAELLGGGARAQTPAPGPSLAFSDQGVQARGMTPGGTVAWFKVGRVVVESAETFVERAEQGTADAQGQATLGMLGAVPRPSIWLAIDVKTGAYALDGFPGFPARRFELAPGAIRPAAGGLGSDRLVDSGDPIEVVLVRPGQGVWSKRVGRGGMDDVSDPADSQLQVALGKLDVLGKGAAAPQKVSAGDLVFVVRPRTLEIGIATVGARP